MTHVKNHYTQLYSLLAAKGLQGLLGFRQSSYAGYYVMKGFYFVLVQGYKSMMNFEADQGVQHLMC